MPPEKQDKTPLPSEPLKDVIKITTKSLVRLRQLPTTLIAQPGRASLPELAHVILTHHNTPPVEGRPFRLALANLPDEEIKKNPKQPYRLQLQGNSLNMFTLVIGINRDLLLDLGMPQIDALLIPAFVVGARFIQATQATFEEVFPPKKEGQKNKLPKDITFADRYSEVYLEAYTLQRLYMEHMNTLEDPTTDSPTPVFNTIPTPQEVHTQVSEVLFGRQSASKQFPPIDVGFEDIRIAFEGPTDKQIQNDPHVIMRTLDLKHLAGNPREQQRFLAAFAFYLAKEMQPDTIDAALMRRVMRREAAYLQDPDIRRNFLHIWTEHPLLKFMLLRANAQQDVLSFMIHAFKLEANEIGLEGRQVDASLFDVHSTAYYAAVSMGEQLLQDIVHDWNIEENA